MNTMTNDLTTLKALLAERDEAIRELNERASSHIKTMLDTVQRLKLELDMATAELRRLSQPKDTILGFPVVVSKAVPNDYILINKEGFFLDCIGTTNGVGKITAPQKL